MESAVKVSSSEKKFITFLMEFIVSTNATEMQTNLEKLSQYMTQNLDPKSEENLYRKQYGNLKQCVLGGKGIMQVFELSGTAFRVQEKKIIDQLKDKGIVTQQCYETYLNGYKQQQTQFRTILKQTGFNFCKVCKQRFYETSNNVGDCNNGQKHKCSFDFSRNEDVLKCDI